MGNRAYLLACPNDGAERHAAGELGERKTALEGGKYTIPLFWLAAFSRQDRHVIAHEGERRVLLCAPVDVAAARLVRRDAIGRWLGDPFDRLYEAWISYVRWRFPARLHCDVSEIVGMSPFDAAVAQLDDTLALLEQLEGAPRTSLEQSPLAPAIQEVRESCAYADVLDQLAWVAGRDFEQWPPEPSKLPEAGEGRIDADQLARELGGVVEGAKVVEVMASMLERSKANLGRLVTSAQGMRPKSVRARVGGELVEVSCARADAPYKLVIALERIWKSWWRKPKREELGQTLGRATRCYPELFGAVDEVEVSFSALPKAAPKASNKPEVVVRHAKFGLGTVQKDLGDKLEIAFGAEHGVKVLLARFVEVVEGG